MKITFYLIRHGQTYFNRYNKLQGWSNSPLTENGISDAKKAGRKLREISFDAAYSSDTTRAIQTADLILAENSSDKQPELLSLPNFREEFYGSYEGTNMDAAWLAAGAPYGLKTYAEIVDDFGLPSTKDFLKAADPWHDAENNDEYWARLDEGFEKILANPKIGDQSQVLLISHGNTLLSLADRYGQDKIGLHTRPSNGSVSKLQYENGHYRFLTFNDQAVD
ncbi:MAG: histidine phosphatase family protein [Oenococcus sp.]|uniref:Phosphoglycerate mutase family protein n=1 Tax=Oenococcus kitaharae DSM 17330 TaxID=1045004 RepID=G9WJP2_9LACO|nr:histidine phosphatase family protein [Oenococcus kitaharae]EHN59241.1 Phosphoglycerate mutase family protein [Oenococcus kitaharae DSM 17330]MCV3296108.1 histidine phosphatase family protein [Oenococcus kitaharae]OEY82231.1 fructose-2,6-bisphosphatase [Oenococcus kitaharae]OEY82654.1 fructose-2,6-bisphosphatase [Oenococcus kitaharae]OEY84911.1 fructose-2,6-bisphosphatase [Oenococcus kitaharae]